MSIISLNQAEPSQVNLQTVEHSALSRVLHNPLLLVFVGGINLILIQWVLVRELTALLMGTELVVMLVSVAYFAGLSVGYFVSKWIKLSWIAPIGVISLVIHLSLPIWFRLLVAGLASTGAYWASFLILPLLTPFIISAFYSIFLPLFADHNQEQLSRLYAVELLGSGVGVLTLVWLGGLGLPTVYLFYGFNIVVILIGLHMRWQSIIIVAITSLTWIGAFPTLSGWSNARFYEAVHHLPEGTITLFSEYSAYQKVDVLQDPNNNQYLYLDSLLHYGTDRWSWLNVVMGAVSADLVKPNSSLVVGAGSMEMARFIAERGGHVTTVELDPVVVKASTEFLSEVNLMGELTNRSVIIDDAKHFMANTTLQYDLIATDVPAAFSVQTATLYSVPFYEQIAKRLTSEGVLVVNLTSRLSDDNLVSKRITASLLAVFDDVVVVTSNSSRLSYVFAGSDLPFSVLQLQNALDNNGERDYTIYHRTVVKNIVGDARPITLDSMDIVLQISADWIADRFNR